MPEKELTLVGHLAELRKRIIYCLIPFLLTVVSSVPFAKALLFFLRIPAQGVIEKLAFFSPQEVVLVYLKISLFSGLILSLPVILYQIWGFILPALAEKQKRFALSFISLALLAFPASAAKKAQLLPTVQQLLVELFLTTPTADLPPERVEEFLAVDPAGLPSEMREGCLAKKEELRAFKKISDGRRKPPVRRVDNAWGDRNLACACPPVEAFA